MGGTPQTELIVLGSTRKQTKQGMGSKSVISTPPWPLHHSASRYPHLVRVPALASLIRL